MRNQQRHLSLGELGEPLEHFGLKRWRNARAAAGKDTTRPNLVTGAVQVCWEKFARYFDVELRQLPVSPGVFTLTPEQVVAGCRGVNAELERTFDQTAASGRAAL